MLTVKKMMENYNVLRISDTDGNWVWSDDFTVDVFFNLDSTHFEVYCNEGEDGINIKILD